MSIDETTIEVTFALYTAPETKTNLTVDYVGTKYKAYDKAASATKSLFNFLRTNPDCMLKYETDTGFVVAGPRSKLYRFLNND